jgi:hypothetical protein
LRTVGPDNEKFFMCSKRMQKAIENLPERFGNKAVVSSSEYDINKNEDFSSFKIEQTHVVSALNKTHESLRIVCVKSQFCM